MMDNRVFNVNGPLRETELLRNTLRLVFAQEGSKTRAKYWMQSKKHGLILFQYRSSTDKELKALPASLDADGAYELAKTWLTSDEAKEVELSDWDENLDHDGSNGPGWRIYIEDWGHVADKWGAICAIKPAYMWYGK